MKYEVRKPTTEEFEQLKQFFVDEGHNEEEAQDLIDNYFYVVIENYTSDCPAYAGKSLIAIYGLPELRQVFIWDDGKLTLSHLDESCLVKKELVI